MGFIFKLITSSKNLKKNHFYSIKITFILHIVLWLKILLHIDDNFELYYF